MADRELEPGREPLAPASRPTAEMPSLPSAHAAHDVLILAAAADHDPDPETLATVERMTAACATCAAIAADLRFLAGGLAALPPEVPAPRDFRITEVQAARLRRGGLLRRLLQPFGLDGLPAIKPLASALTVVGLAGILLTNLPIGLQLGASAGAAPNEDRSTAGGAYGAPAQSTVPEAVVASGGAGAGPGSKNDSPSPSTGSVVLPPASNGDTAARASLAPAQAPGAAHDGGAPGITVPGPNPPAIPPLLVLSVAALAVGLVLLALRLVARRID